MIIFLYDEQDVNQVWFNCFYMAMLSINYVMEKNNIMSKIVNKLDYIYDHNDLIILFSPWFKYLDNDNKFILINSEALYVKRNFHLINNFYKKNVLLWLDYSLKNTKLIKKYTNPKIYHLPICYSETFENIIDNNLNDKSIDILFYGYMNERRLSIGKELEKYNLKVVFSMFSTYTELIHHINHSKIILVIYFYEDCFCIDHYRINFLLANKVFIIHEKIEEDESYANYKDNIIFSKYKNIVKTCLKYLNLHQSDRDLICNNIYEWYKKEENIEKYIPLDEIKKLI